MLPKWTKLQDFKVVTETSQKQFQDLLNFFAGSLWACFNVDNDFLKTLQISKRPKFRRLFHYEQNKFF